jgi:hypothetical protein
MAAMRYYNQSDQQSAGGYSDSEWAAIGRRIASSLGSGYHLEGGKIVSSDVKKDATNSLDMGTCPMCGAEMNDANCTSCDYTAPDTDMESPDEDMSDTTEKSVDLQNNNLTDSVTNMELSTDQKVSMVQKFMTWLGFESDEVTKAASTVEETEEIVEKTEEVVEKDGGSEVDINEITTALSAILDEKLTKVRDDIEASVEAKINEKIETVTKSVSEVAEKVETVSNSVTEVSEKVETIDETSAVKKSVETDEETEKVEKSVKPSFWGNIFVPAEIVEVLGYES